MTVTIDFNTLTASSNNLGHIGEHNATELQITYVNDDSRITLYRIAFATGSATILSQAYTEMPISIYLWAQLTKCPRISIQVICYDSEGEYIGKSAKMSGFYFEPSIKDSTVEADGSNADMAGEIAGITERLDSDEATLATKADASALDDYAKVTDLDDYLKTEDASKTYATKVELTKASHMELVNRTAPRVCLYTCAEIYEALNSNRVLTLTGIPLTIRRFDTTQFVGSYVDGVYEYSVSMAYSEQPKLTVKEERTLATQEELAYKQDVLASGTNIKTINKQSILGSGNIDIAGGSGNVDDVIVNGDSVVNDDKQAIITVPTKVSDLPNDAGYLTEHQSLDGYATESYVQSYHDFTKADTFTTDTTVTEGSANPVSSGAVYTAISNAIADLDTIIGTGVIE